MKRKQLDMIKQTGFLKHPVTNQTDELFGTKTGVKFS